MLSLNVGGTPKFTVRSSWEDGKRAIAGRGVPVLRVTGRCVFGFFRRFLLTGI